MLRLKLNYAQNPIVNEHLPKYKIYGYVLLWKVNLSPSLWSYYYQIKTLFNTKKNMDRILLFQGL